MASVEELKEVCTSDQYSGRFFALILTRRLCDVAAAAAIILTKVVVEKSVPAVRRQRSLRPFDEGISNSDETEI